MSGALAVSACGGDDELALSAVTPAGGSARGGDEVTLIGKGFVSGASVTFGPDAAASVTLQSAEQLVAVTPFRLAGPVDVTVRNPDGESATLGAGFRFEPLELEFVRAAPYYVPDLSSDAISDAVAADLDGDGATDVLVAVVGEPSRLLRNQGTGSFVDESLPPPDTGGAGGAGGASDGGAGTGGGAGGAGTGGAPDGGAGTGGAGTGGADAGGAGGSVPVATWVHDSARMLLEDFDADERVDVLLCNRSGQPHRVYTNDGDGEFSASSAMSLPETSDECRAAALADVDGDGQDDLVVAGGGRVGSGDGYVRIYRRSGDSFAVAEELEPAAEVEGTACGTATTTEPLAVVSYLFNETEVSSGEAAGLAAYDFSAALAPSPVALGYALPRLTRVPRAVELSVRGDGQGAALALQIVDGAGEQFASPAETVSGSSWQSLRFDELGTWTATGGDADGQMDLPLQSLTLVVTPSGLAPATLGVDDVRLEVPDVGLVIVEDFERRDFHLRWPTAIDSVSAADFDGDGDVDLVVSSESDAATAQLRLVLNDGLDAGGALRLRELPGGALGAVAEGISFTLPLDLDGDGALDLFAVASNGQDRLLVNDGTAHFYDDTTSTLPVDRGNGRHAALADFDLDAQDDLAIANFGAVTRLYVSEGSLGFLDATPALPLDATNALRVLPLDAEQDGDMDLFVVNGPGERSVLYISTEPGDHER